MNPIHLLLVEDEPLIALSAQGALEDGGYSVHVASSGDEATAALETSATISGLLTDIRCGSGLDGWAIARRARELHPHMPVIYITGDSGHEHSAYGVPDSIMLEKPFAMAQLVTAISMLLNAALPEPAKVATGS